MILIEPGQLWQALYNLTAESVGSNTGRMDVGIKHKQIILITHAEAVDRYSVSVKFLVNEKHCFYSSFEYNKWQDVFLRLYPEHYNKFR